MTDQRPDDSTPDWLADYDEALRRGEVLPATDAIPDGADPDQESREMRDLLQFMDWALRAQASGARGVATLTDEADAADGPRTEGSTEGAGYPPLGRFLIERELGRGGYGVVYLARDPEMDRHVALKLPGAESLYSPGTRRRFLREARAAARLDHPNLVPMYEAGQVGPICYIASAYCAGPNLARWLAARNGPLGPRPAARLVLALAGAVAHIHDRGLLHCDLKPGNVLIDPPDRPDGDPVPRITDFGLARLHEAAPTGSTAGRPLGTPPYMAPEQIVRRGGIGPATDVYALGAILYELLTGRLPHDAESPWLVMQAVVAAPPVPPRHRLRSIPRDLEAICLRCLEKQPEARYATADDLADDLQRYLDGRPTAARPLGPLRRGARWCRRKPTAAALLGLASLTLAVSLGSAVILSRANQRLEHANAQALIHLEAERRHRYDADLALAQQDARRGRIAPAQRRLRQWLPKPGEPDSRDFAWFYLYGSTRHDRTVLSELMPGVTCNVAVAGDLLLGLTPSFGFWEIEMADPKANPMFAASRPRFRFRPGPTGLNTRENGDLSPDGRLVVVDRRDDQGRDGLTFLDARTGAVLADVPWPEKLGDVRFSADGRAVAVGLLDSLDRIPHVTTRTITLADGRRVVAYGMTRAHSIASRFDPARVFGLRFAVAHKPNPWRLTAWDLNAGTHLWARPEEEKGEEVLTEALAYSPCPGGPIATATPGGTVQLHDPADGSVIAKLEGHGDLVRALAFSSDGRILAAGANRRAILWDVSAKREVAALEGLGGEIRSIAFLSDSSDVALGIGSGQVVVWHTKPLGEAVIANAHDDEVWGLAYSPDGRLLASVGGDRLVKLWDARNGRLVRTLTGHEDWPTRVVISPDGRLVASANFRGRVHVWEVESGRLQKSYTAHEGRICSLKFSPDGQLLATCGFDRSIRLWDADAWEPAGVLGAHGDNVRDLVFLPDGTNLISASDDASVALWDWPSRRLLVRLPLPADTNASCLAVSPDGATIAAGDDHGVVRLWDAEARRLRATLRGLHSEEVSDVAFTPDGRILAVAGQDRLISLVDVTTGQPLIVLSGHGGGVNQVAFSPDGRTLASAGHDHSIRLWQGDFHPTSDLAPD